MIDSDPAVPNRATEYEVRHSAFDGQLRTIYLSREDWLAARPASLGASEWAAALGESSYSSPFYSWAVKTGRLNPPDLSKNELVEWGLRLERVIALAAGDRTGREIVLPPEEEWHVYRHRDYAWLTATPDAIQIDKTLGQGPLQVKNVGAWGRRLWKDGPPLEYEIQLQGELFVTGASWGSLVALCGGNRLLGPFDYKRDDDLYLRALPALVEFWDHVRDGSPPELDSSPATSKALSQMYAEDDGTAVMLDEECLGAYSRLECLAAEQKVRADEEKKLKNVVRAAMGDAAIGLLPGSECSFTNHLVAKREYTVCAQTFRVLRRKAKAARRLR